MDTEQVRIWTKQRKSHLRVWKGGCEIRGNPKEKLLYAGVSGRDSVNLKVVIEVRGNTSATGPR